MHKACALSTKVPDLYVKLLTSATCTSGRWLCWFGWLQSSYNYWTVQWCLGKEYRLLCSSFKRLWLHGPSDRSPSQQGRAWAGHCCQETPGGMAWGSVHQLCSQGGSVRAGGQHWSNIEQGPLILKLQIPTPWAKTLPILTQRFPKQDLLPKSQECYSWRCDHELGRNSAVYGTVWLMSPSGTALQREMGLSKEKKGGFLISTSSGCGPHFLKCHSEWVKGKIHKCEIKLLREVPGSGWVPWKKCSIALCTTSRWKSQWNEADLKLLFLPTLAGFSL